MPGSRAASDLAMKAAQDNTRVKTSMPAMQKLPDTVGPTKSKPMVEIKPK